MRLGVALITASIGFAIGDPAAQAGPCSNEIMALEFALGTSGSSAAPPSRSSSGAPASAKRTEPPAESRFDPALARAKKLDAEDNADCWKPIAEIKMLLGM
jgi:hypothetical protein